MTAPAAAQDLRCILPVTVRRAAHARSQAMGGPNGQIARMLPARRRRDADSLPPAGAMEVAGIVRVLPAPVLRGQALQAAALEIAGIVRMLPAPVARNAPAQAAALTAAADLRRILPQAVARAATVTSIEVGEASPLLPAPSQDRAPIPIAALLRIVERVARGISGAAGYAYMGEDPAGAGLRYGLLGLRLDTGDMGGALQLALTRNRSAVLGALGVGAEALLGTALAATPEARRQPVQGAPLWEGAWKAALSRTATLDIFRAAQNEYAVEYLMRPAAALLLAHASLASGVALAMALDVLAEVGREPGLALLAQALEQGGGDSLAALRDRLAAAVPSSGVRLSGLVHDRQLADWRPDPVGGQA
jgi:hypothetical protein